MVLGTIKIILYPKHKERERNEVFMVVAMIAKLI